MVEICVNYSLPVLKTNKKCRSPPFFLLAQDMYEYLVASQMWHSLMESATSEQSSRMNAMENASKNAGEMIDSLTLIYNRARQSRITTELIEIISGASALEEAK